MSLTETDASREKARTPWLVWVVVGVVVIILLISASSQDVMKNAIHAGQIAAESTLKDPSSARHIETFVVGGKGELGKGTLYVCGTIDGKNAFGAYTGGVRYVVRQSIGNDGTNVRNENIHLEDSDRQATSETRNSKNRETIFEKVYWNPSCTDENHPPSYTGTAW